jgi:hypothetical protein
LQALGASALSPLVLASASELVAARQPSNMIAEMKTDNRMPAMFGCGAAPNNARAVYERFHGGDVGAAARCAESLAALDFPG